MMVASEAALAAPAVTTIAGSVADGASITINGSGFGSASSTPLLWDNFEAGTVGARLNSSPRVGSWQVDTRPNPVYSSTTAVSGSRSSYAAYDTDNQWSQFVANLPRVDRIYQSFWFRYATSGTNGQLKLVQVHGDSGTGDFAPGIMTGSSTVGWWFSYITTENQSLDLGTRVSYDNHPSQGAWHHFEMAMKRSSGGGVADGSVTIWIDGKTAYSRQNAVTRQSSSYNWSETSFFHGVTNMGARTDVFVDDAYLADSWARVVIGDAATYSAVTKRHVQPVESWSATAVRVRLNKGSFSDFSDKYLYVFDASGAVNSNGYKLDCASCTTPNPPTSVSVQ